MQERAIPRPAKQSEPSQTNIPWLRRLYAPAIFTAAHGVEYAALFRSQTKHSETPTSLCHGRPFQPAVEERIRLGSVDLVRPVESGDASLFGNAEPAV